MQKNENKLEQHRNNTIILCRKLDEELARRCPKKWNGNNEDKKAYNSIVCAVDSLIAALTNIINKY